MLHTKRRRGRHEEIIQHDIREALDVIRPILRIEECALTLESFEVGTGVATLLANGGCRECDLSVGTFIQGIEAQLKRRVPEIIEVRLAQAGTK